MKENRNGFVWDSTTRNKIIQWTLGAVGAGISLAGALGIGASQLDFPGASIWPLPGLVLLDWAVLGVIGFLGLLSEENSKLPFKLNLSWFVVGALIPLMILGAFSIGPFVLLSLIAFFVAVLLASAQTGGSRLDYWKALLFGVIANLALLLLFITFGRPPV